MRNRLFWLGLASLLVAVVAGTVWLVVVAHRPQPPTFVLRDKRDPSKALAVYADAAILKQYRLSPEKFEAASQAFIFDKTIACAMVETFFPDENTARRERAARSLKDFESRFNITVEDFLKIVKTTRNEEWTFLPDGSHRVEKSPSPTDKDSSVAANKITQEEAEATFTRNTGIAWPDAAGGIRFDEKRDGFFGDGQFYIVFTVSEETLKKWLDASPPWGKRWLQGPIPADVGHRCGFGFESPHGWSEMKDGSKEYSGGAPVILAILNSRGVWYDARDRSPSGSNRWYNADVLIVAPKTAVDRYCSWDM